MIANALAIGECENDVQARLIFSIVIRFIFEKGGCATDNVGVGVGRTKDAPPISRRNQQRSFIM